MMLAPRRNADNIGGKYMSPSIRTWGLVGSGGLALLHAQPRLEGSD
ncbi:MAG TPA: hypothetical protein VJG32_16575 [Anaerolineae bacterium]|nr:hypothetical protein [Anaerolineae bacterium]